MAQNKQPKDPAFEISFYESVLKNYPDYEEVVELLAALYTQEGRIQDGLKMDQKLVELEPENSTAHYNLACSLALTGEKQAAVDALHQAIKLGYEDFNWLMNDPDLKPLYDFEPFHAVLRKIKDSL